MKRINRREELARYTIADQGTAIKGYSGLAAGPGRELEQCTELMYVREISGSRGFSYARVAGESMMDTILRGDRILLKEWAGGIELPPRGNNPKNDLNILRNEVPHESICIVQINDDYPTLKRVMYDTRAGVADWRLLIAADNPDEWVTYAVKKQDSVKFWAKVMGLLDVA